MNTLWVRGVGLRVGYLCTRMTASSLLAKIRPDHRELLHLLTAGFGTLRRIAAMHKLWELSEVQRTCHEIGRAYQSDVNDPQSTLGKPARETARMMATSPRRWTTKCFEFCFHA